MLSIIFYVKLCRYQHLEVSEKLPTDAWFPCTAQFDTNNKLEHSFWLKVCAFLCMYACTVSTFPFHWMTVDGYSSSTASHSFQSFVKWGRRPSHTGCLLKPPHTHTSLNFEQLHDSYNTLVTINAHLPGQLWIMSSNDLWMITKLRLTLYLIVIYKFIIIPSDVNMSITYEPFKH